MQDDKNTLEILKCLELGDDLTAYDLAYLIDMSRPAIINRINVLVAANFVKSKKNNEESKEKRFFSITKTGKVLFKELIQKHDIGILGEFDFDKWFLNKFKEKYNDKLFDLYWKSLRTLILKRDKKKCVFCGKRKNLDIHHIDGNGFSKPILERNNYVYNLITLCKGCHNYAHSSNTKINCNTTEILEATLFDEFIKNRFWN